MAVGKTFNCADLNFAPDDLVLTFVVPAPPTGCNQKCPSCYIEQRKLEAQVYRISPALSRLAPLDYSCFIASVTANASVAAVAVQGVEPTLSLDYTRAVLGTALQHGIPSALVTNGMALSAEVAEEFVGLQLGDLTISLDSDVADINDKLRGVPGARDRTIAGVKAAMRHPRFAERLFIASVLYPGKRAYLEGMPRLLAQLGVRNFGVTPYISIGRDTRGRMRQSHADIVRDLDVLAEFSEREGIRFVVDDTFGVFRHLEDGMDRLMVHRLKNAQKLIRLGPTGAVSIGAGVLEAVDAKTPIWKPSDEAPWALLKRLGLEPRDRQQRPNGTEVRACNVVA
ncbi:MAG: hypothetical protein C0465_17870 [Ralstonia sp.]|uniref:radical SAM protein n=1 Tax=Ralstonia sp. TaxID=54061 RepID=UPI00257DA03D|nr:radical SAM protein [Ralstonia sp.]MBA4232469.1 hypothetical protein [Ralstonia sp.]